MVCGFGDQVGYEALVRKLAKAQIDKSSRFTDWSRRPLSQKQLAYALSDVTHLQDHLREAEGPARALRPRAVARGGNGGSDLARDLRDAPEDAWKRVKFRPRSRKQLAVLVAVSAWREREAQERNVPRSRVIKDDAIAEIATQVPPIRAALKSLRALPRGYAGSRDRRGDSQGGHVRSCARSAGRCRSSTIRRCPDRARSVIAEVLKLALKVVCDRDGIAPRSSPAPATSRRSPSTMTPTCPFSRAGGATVRRYGDQDQGRRGGDRLAERQAAAHAVRRRCRSRNEGGGVDAATSISADLMRAAEPRRRASTAKRFSTRSPTQLGELSAEVREAMPCRCAAAA